MCLAQLCDVLLRILDGLVHRNETFLGKLQKVCKMVIIVIARPNHF